MPDGQHRRDGFGEDVLGRDVVNERRTGQARIQPTLAQPLDQRADRMVLGRQDQLAVRVRERPHQRRDDVVADRRQVTDTDRLTLTDGDALDVIERPIRLGDQRPRLHLQLLSDGRQPHATGSTREQRRSYLPLERADLLGQRLLGDRDARGGGADAALVGDGQEVAELAQVERHAVESRYRLSLYPDRMLVLAAPDDRTYRGPMTNQIPPRTWMITGTSSGLGSALAKAALAAGDRVIATARRPEALDALVREAPDRVAAVRLDVTMPNEITVAVAAGLERFGQIDVLVNNAGYGSVGAVDRMDGSQPGDPDRAAAAILDVIDADDAPLRLALGDDAVDAIRSKHDQLRADLDGWENVSRSTTLVQAL